MYITAEKDHRPLVVLGGEQPPAWPRNYDIQHCASLCLLYTVHRVRLKMLSLFSCVDLKK